MWTLLKFFFFIALIYIIIIVLYSFVFDIDPINDKLIVQAKLSVDQIGYIKKRQKVNVKLAGKNI